MASPGNFPDLFDASTLDAAIARINRLTPETPPVWGRMTVDQMLAHLCVSYEMVYTTKHKRPNVLMRWVLKRIVKDRVMNDVPYAQGTPTAPAFRITDARDFQAERERLIGYLRRVQADGRSAFEGRESLSFGPLSAAEWNALFSKHIDHHLRQFGV